MTTRPNGCHNRPPLQQARWMQDGWIRTEAEGQPTMVPRMIVVPHRMSTDCHYSRDPMGCGQQDPRCEGCRWRHPAPPNQETP